MRRERNTFAFSPRANATRAERQHGPVYIAFAIRRPKGGKSIWTEIGRAYPHEEGAGLTVVFDALPLTKRIVLLEPDLE